MYTCFALKFLVQCCIFFQGDWWIAKKFDDITGNTAIEMEDMRYVAAQDDGRFKLGPPRDEGI